MQKLVKIRFLRDFDFPSAQRGSGRATDKIIVSGTELEVEDYGEVNGQRMLRYCDTRIPNDIVDILE
jgi:hypothetical protein